CHRSPGPPDLRPFPPRRSSDLQLPRFACAYLKAVTAPHPPLIKNRIIKATTNHRSDFPCGSRARAWVENAIMLWPFAEGVDSRTDRKSTRLNSSHVSTSYAVFC